MGKVFNWQLGREMEYPYEDARPERQIAWVFDLNKCIACQTCSVACKMTWSSGRGQEYMFWNNVETKPYGCYPTAWDLAILEKLGPQFGRTVEMIGTFGYTSWQGNERSTARGGEPADRSATLVEIGVKVYTGGSSVRPYAMGLVGVHNVTRDETGLGWGGGGYKATLPCVAPGLGLEVQLNRRMWLDVSGRFRSVFNLSPVDSSSNEPSWHMLATRLGVLIRI